jgi:hypothetical protein
LCSGGIESRRINRLRWDKPPREADRLETLERMLEKIETGRGAPAAARQREDVLVKRWFFLGNFGICDPR